MGKTGSSAERRIDLRECGDDELELATVRSVLCQRVCLQVHASELRELAQLLLNLPPLAQLIAVALQMREEW